MRAFTQTIVSPGHEISGVTAAVFIGGADLPGDDWAADDWAGDGWVGAVGVLAITGADAIAAKLAMASTNRFMDDPVPSASQVGCLTAQRLIEPAGPVFTKRQAACRPGSPAVDDFQGRLA